MSWRVPADLIHLHHPFPPGDLVYWSRLRRLPLVITHHSDIVRQKRLLQLYRPLLQLTLRAARRIIATSPQYIQSSPWLRPHADKCAVIPLSVEAARFASPDRGRVAELKARYGLTLIFIAHDLAVVKNISDRICVMYLGKLCEVGPPTELYSQPAHPYTAALLSSIPVPNRVRSNVRRRSGRSATSRPPWRNTRWISTSMPIGSARCSRM